jgi:hypothetical protein
MFVELLSLRAQVWLRGVKLFRSSTKSVLLYNRKQILEIAILSPIVHTHLPATGLRVTSITKGKRSNMRLYLACGNPTSPEPS